MGWKLLSPKWSGPPLWLPSACLQPIWTLLAFTPAEISTYPALSATAMETGISIFNEASTPAAHSTVAWVVTIDGERPGIALPVQSLKPVAVT